MNEKKKQKVGGFISLGVYFLLIVLTIFNVGQRELGTLEPTYVINVSADIFAMTIIWHWLWPMFPIKGSRPPYS